MSIPFEHGAPRPSEGLGAGGRFDILFVRVETDAGITGWGEAFGYAAGPVMMAALTRGAGTINARSAVVVRARQRTPAGKLGKHHEAAC